MIDNFALAISHGLIALAVWRLLRRPELDQEGDARGPGLKRKGPPVA